jgi:hypothetical protein
VIASRAAREETHVHVPAETESSESGFTTGAVDIKEGNVVDDWSGDRADDEQD